MYSRRGFYRLKTQVKAILILFLCCQASACGLSNRKAANSTALKSPSNWEISKGKNTSTSPWQAKMSGAAAADPPTQQAAAEGAGSSKTAVSVSSNPLLSPEPIVERDIPPEPTFERDIVRSASSRTPSRADSVGANRMSKAFAPASSDLDKIQTKTSSSTLVSDTPVSEKVYRGKPISLDFQDADIRSVLRIIGEVSNHNMVIDPDVKGRVTVTIQNPVPWDQALDIILKTNQLAMRMEGNIIRIETQRTFQQEEDAAVKAIQAKQMAEQAQKNSRPLKTEIISVNYAQASKLKEQISPMLTDPKGLQEPSSIIVDERTNSLIIKDLPENLAKIKEVLAKLDRETPQVMIETRIVETNKSYLKELGIRWGGGYGRQTNYRFPRTIDISGIRGGTYAVNLPNKGDVFGGVGLNLGHINNLIQLNIELESMESQGKGRIISNPRIATLDNEKAEIKSGSQIPYPSVDKEGNPSTNFVDAVIRLGVTPHITPNDYITLEIEADKSEPNWAQTVNGVPAITTRTATTKLIVKDGDTTVIGGLYQRTQQQNEQKVPWFANIPGLGWLFRSQGAVEKYDELLIFITPRIVKKNS
ncbi:MAG: type IV pilus secretin PilQ [bacterium]|nr:type IV pilus secretin PilQ [bacterium]